MRPRAVAALLLGSIVLLGQEPAEGPGERIQVEVNVVNIPVTVRDGGGRFIVDLTKDDFEITEDGQPVEIRYFAQSHEQADPPPLRVGFLIDLSNTARLYYKTYKDSIGDLAYLLAPEGGRNKAFLMGYHTEVDLLVDTTNDPYLIAHRMENLKHGGGSALLEAVYKACTEKLVSDPYQGAGEPRKVVVIVGDGHDNASKYTVEQVIDAAQRNQVTIYAISTEAWGYHEEQEQNLHRMASETGGRVTQPMQDVHKDVPGQLSRSQDSGNYAYTVGTGEAALAQRKALSQAILDITGEVKSQYVLGYVPPTPFSDGRFRKVKVRVKLGVEVEVNHRSGYFPPEIK